MNEKLYLKTKKHLIILLICVFACTCILIGSTYAYFSSVSVQEEANTIQVGTLKIAYDDETAGLGDVISLNNAFPIPDSEGMKQVGYKFEITNTGTLNANYTVAIEDDQSMIDIDDCSDNLLSHQNIKYSVNGGTPTILSTKTNGVISEGMIRAGETIHYEIKMWIDEASGNEVLGKHFHGKVVINSVQSEDQSQIYVDDSGANAPELIEGLIPVTWNGSDWVKADTASKWYDYDEQMWANAVTVTSASRSEYNSAAANTVISMDDIETMWVWIPRYSYTIKSTVSYESPGRTSTYTGSLSLSFTPTTDGVLSFSPTIIDGGYNSDIMIAINGENLSAYNDNTGWTTDVSNGIEYGLKANTTYNLTFTNSYGSSAPGACLALDDNSYVCQNVLQINNFSITSQLNGEIETVNDGWIITESTYGVQGYGGSTLSQSTPGAIDIKFIDVDTKETGGATYSGSSPENWRTPDGFTFGDQKLPGIWVAKFETSSTSTTPNTDDGGGNTTSYDPLVKPDVISWRSINVSNAFTVSRKLTAEGNRYGLDTNADGHMMKNSEWGLVTYLSQSKYGKYGNTDYTGTNKEVYINNYDSYRTGCSAGNPSASSSSNCQYTYSVEGSGTGASTTGTIYGVYDMSGGAFEYTMSNYNGTISSAGFSSLPDSKYYDRYTTTTPLTACNGGVCYGHALSETSGWYNDLAYMVSSGSPWARRGGYYNNSSGTGVFNFIGIYGFDYSTLSFRLVLVP